MKTLRPLFPFICLLVLSYVKTITAWSPPLSSRREVLTKKLPNSLLLTTCVVTASPQDAVAATDELPSFLRPFTKLAPLGSPETSKNKTMNLSLQEISDRLSKALVEGDAGKGGYFLTGDLPVDIFRDDCVFIDPTNQVSSTSQYQNALRVLFDPSQSVVEIVKPLTIDESSRTITTTIRSRGVLRFPWKPRVKAYESAIIYTVDDNGLISRQAQTWTKSASEALRESFTPSLFPPAPKSSLSVPTDEPLEVTKLFNMLNGRRPDEYSQEERFEIAALIDGVVDKRYKWKRDLLPGKWIIAYLQPGPDGGGIDRRIPFPEFPFNDYQVFGEGTVVNIGELLGPLLRVEVGGSLKEQDSTSLNVPKRFIANITSGKLCAWENSCVPLPILGEGLFDGVYLGARLRIGQNINGGGARVVQLRLE